METIRTGHTVWGQQVIEGVSWDLLPVAFGIGLVVILGHAIFSRLRRKRGPRA
jgi:hypothetical protein